MAYWVELRDEARQPIAPGIVLPPAALPEFDNERYPCLRLIDPYSTTVFNRLQMAAVLPELERWAQQTWQWPSELNSVVELARLCSVEIHRFLYFVGD